MQKFCLDSKKAFSNTMIKVVIAIALIMIAFAIFFSFANNFTEVIFG